MNLRIKNFPFWYSGHHQYAEKMVILAVGHVSYRYSSRYRQKINVSRIALT